jgi:hypothetical protein
MRCASRSMKSRTLRQVELTLLDTYVGTATAQSLLMSDRFAEPCALHALTAVPSAAAARCR